MSSPKGSREILLDGLVIGLCSSLGWIVSLLLKNRLSLA